MKQDETRQDKSMRKHLPQNSALSRKKKKKPLLHEELHKKNAFPNHETKKETLGERGQKEKGSFGDLLFSRKMHGMEAPDPGDHSRTTQ